MSGVSFLEQLRKKQDEENKNSSGIEYLNGLRNGQENQSPEAAVSQTLPQKFVSNFTQTNDPAVAAVTSIASDILPSVDDIKQRVKNIQSIYESATKWAMGRDLTPAQQNVVGEVQTAAERGLKSRLNIALDLTPGMEDRIATPVANAIKSASLTSVKQSVIDAFSKVHDQATSTDFSTLIKMPIDMVKSMVGDAFGTTTALDLSGNTVKALSQEEVDRATKSTIGNVVASAVAPLAEELMAARFAAPVTKLTGGLDAASMMNAPLENVAKASMIKPKLGKIGEAILSDAVAAGAAGAAQGAVANEGSPEMLSAAATGLLFAPIGIFTGWLRGVEAPTGILESATTKAYDVKNIRLWQNATDANVESLTKKVSNILSADKIEDVLLKDNDQFTQPVGNVKVPISEPIKNIGADYADYAKSEKNPLSFNDWKKRFEKSPQINIKPDQIRQVLIDKGLSPDLDELFKTFSKTLKEGVSYETALAEFAQKNDLVEHLPELREKFVTKFYEQDPNYNEFMKGTIEAQRKALAGKFDAPDLMAAADKHGFVFTNEFGKIHIRDIESGEVVGTAYNTDEAIEIMKIMGEHPNPVIHDAGAQIPAPPGNVQPPISQFHMQGWEPEHFDQHWGSRLNQWFMKNDRHMSILSSMNARIESFDAINHALAGESPITTDFKNKFFNPLEEAHRLSLYHTKENLSSPIVRSYNAFVESKANKFTTADIENAGHILEAESHANLILPNGYAKGFTISQDAQDLAKFAYENKVDLTKIGLYRRKVLAAKSDFIKRAYENTQTNQMLGAISDAGDALNAQMGSMDKDPVFAADMARINNIFKPDKTFQQAHDMVEKLYTKPDGSAHLAGATRLKLALDDPMHFGMTREDFIKQHNIRPEVAELAKRTEAMFNHFGQKFGVPDSRMLMRYMNHYRQFGDMLDSNFINDFEAGIMDPTMKQFASSMIRTGEVANYSMNAVANLYSYIRGGTKAQYLYPAINEMTRVDGPFTSELKKVTNPKNKAQIVKWADAYQRDITGQKSIDDKDWENIQVEHLKALKDNNGGAKLTGDEIIKKMQEPSFVDTIMSLSSAGLLGARVSLAARDNIDLMQKFFTKHGVARTYDLAFTKVTPAKIAELERQGFIINPEGADVYNITHGALSENARAISNAGFKMSGQAYYYLKNQAAVWEHTMNNTGRVLSDMDKGIISSKSEAYKKLFLNGYDVSTQKKFNAYVQDHNYDAASRTLATEEVREMVGYFTKGNQAPILNSKPGRLFGQLGSWSMTNRSALQNILTRGTKEEMRTRLARYVIANGALVTVGAAAGMNLGRWLLLPTSVLNVGGPVLSSLQAISGALASNLGGSDAQSNFTNRALLTAGKQFIPFSYAASDVAKGVDLVQHGSGYDPVRVGLQMLGVPANKEDGTWLDYMNGTHPVHWPDPTPTNVNPFNNKPFNLNPFDY